MGMEISTATMESSMEVPQKAKCRTTILFRITTPEYIYKGM
jgi:hypothetical protein